MRWKGTGPQRPRETERSSVTPNREAEEVTPRLDSMTRLELIFTQLPGTDRKSVLRAISRRLAAQGLVRDEEVLFRKLCEREELGSTGIGRQVAVPHCKVKGLEDTVISVAVCVEEIDFGAVDQKPVRVLFTVVSPENDPAAHLQSLAAISHWVKANHHVEKILQQEGRDGILELLGRDGGAGGE